MDKLSVQVTIRHLALVCGLALSGVAAVAYAWVNAWVVSLDSIVKILALGVGATTAIYAAMTLALIYAAHQQTVDLKRKEFAARLMERWLDKDMTATLQTIGPFVKEAEKLTESEVSDRLTANESLRHACLSLLNFLEGMATELKYGLADEPMLKEFFNGVVRVYFGKLKRVVDVRRARTDNPRIYKTLEALAKAWGE